jgi:transcriptional regulator with GAF, ATPase, and Fis domain
MPLGMQVKLLRVLQERKVKAVGDLREVPVDVRVIAATNRDLAAEVRAGRFREDLYYRLNVISIELPSLRDRPSDIPLLAHHFLRKYATEFDKPVRDIDPDAMQLLLAHPFSGNVRELENVIERAVALEDGTRITARSLPPGLRTPTVDPAPRPPEALTLSPTGIDLEDVVGDVERRLIEQALAATGGRKKGSRPPARHHLPLAALPAREAQDGDRRRRLTPPSRCPDRSRCPKTAPLPQNVSPRRPQCAPDDAQTHHRTTRCTRKEAGTTRANLFLRTRRS